ALLLAFLSPDRLSDAQSLELSVPSPDDQSSDLSIQNQNSKLKNPEALATLVIFNNADPVSVELAGYYAEKRGIPFDHLIGLDCPLTEEISRKDYEQTIA